MAKTTIDLANDVRGLLPVSNGGSGSSSPSLVAGTNVTITGSWPNQTVAASGGGGTTLSFFRTPYTSSNASGPPAANAIELTPFILPGTLSVSHVGIQINAANATVTGDFGIYDTSGNLLASVGGFALGTLGVQEQAIAGAPISIPAGSYYAAWAQTDTTGRIGIWNTANLSPLTTTRSTTNATAGVLPGSIVIPVGGVVSNVLAMLAFTLR